MLTRTEGIVLRTIPFGEADIIATYLSPEHGLLKVFAKSPRKIRSRFGSSLEPLTHARISFWGKENTALPRLTQSDILNPFHSLRDKLDCFLKVSEIIELTLHFVPERDSNIKAYSLLLNTLQAVEKERIAEDLILSQYKIKFLKLTGFAPKVDACGRCGKNGYSFFLSQGAIMCKDCMKGAESIYENGPAICLSPAVARFYNDLMTWDASKINRIRPSEALYAELSKVLNVHIQYILAKSLRSSDFNRTAKMR
jgi:DNA repair protein RecO (recombination protein O)